MYRFRAKSREYVWLRTNCFSFQNPYTDEVEYVVCTNSTIQYVPCSIHAPPCMHIAYMKVRNVLYCVFDATQRAHFTGVFYNAKLPYALLRND